MVKLKPEVGGDEINVEINDRKDGTYLAVYTIDELYGKLTLSVCLRGAHIKGSPFAVNSVSSVLALLQSERKTV